MFGGLWIICMCQPKNHTHAFVMVKAMRLGCGWNGMMHYIIHGKLDRWCNERNLGKQWTRMLGGVNLFPYISMLSGLTNKM